mmetsp:Transcript_3551/g.8114  ORF Transcript_3551/g.8114 Transcript_3551/m.8114 type:complete len:115 (-) Transcript_3551:475-819(-)
MMIPVGDFRLYAGRHSREPLDGPLRGVRDVVASDEVQGRNRKAKSVPVFVGEYRWKDEPTSPVASLCDDVFVDHFVDDHSRLVAADRVWRVPVKVTSSDGATTARHCPVEDGTN